MPRSISIHPGSLLAGVALAGVALLSMSQTPPLNAREVVVQYGPNPRDMVQIKQGIPFVVPAGRLFVLTGLGFADEFSNGQIGGACSLRVNGQTEVAVAAAYEFNPQGWLLNGTSSVVAVPTGFTAPAGSSIELIFPSGDGRAWGYLAPQ